jgi:hypothetical protein
LRNRFRRLAPIPVALLLSLSLFAVVSEAAVNLSGLVARPAPAGQGGTTQAGAASTFHLHADLSSQPGSDDLRNLTFHLPPGLVGNPNAATRCTVAQFNADACPASSRVGEASNSLVAETSLGDRDVTIHGDVYNVVPALGQPARFGIVLRPEPLTELDVTVATFSVVTLTTGCVPNPAAGCFFLRADLTVTSPKQFQQVPVTLRPGDLGIDNTLADLPRDVDVTISTDLTRLCGESGPPGTCSFDIPFTGPDPDPEPDTFDIKLTSIDTLLFARAPSGQPFITNPTSCGPATTGFDALSYQGALTMGSAGFTPTGCNLLPFSPNVGITVAARSLAAGARPSVTAVVTQASGEANQRQAQVTLPAGISPDDSLIPLACPEANLEAGTCPQTSLIGQATLTSPLFPAPLIGPIYTVQDTPLPGIAVDLRGAGIPAILRATNEIASNFRLRNVFGPLPDVPLSRFELRFNGGQGGPLLTTERLCTGNRQFNASFSAHSGAQHSVQGAARFNGNCPPRARPKCGGVRATIIGNGRANRLIGTNRRDVIVARRGNDTVRSRGGNDIICAGPGNDRVFAGNGNDKAFGGSGKDLLRGGRGADLLRGGRGNDTCFGGAGRDRLRSC